MFYMFTERSRLVIRRAEHAAGARKHDLITVQHLLFALLFVESPAKQALLALGWTEDKVRDLLPPEGQISRPDKIPFTPRAKKMLELALREALSLGHNYIGPEHILLAFANEERIWEGIFAPVEVMSIRHAVLLLVQPQTQHEHFPGDECESSTVALEESSIALGECTRLLEHIMSVDLAWLDAKDLVALGKILRKMQTSAEEASG